MKKISLVVVLSVIFTLGLCFVPRTEAENKISGTFQEVHGFSQEKFPHEIVCAQGSESAMCRLFPMEHVNHVQGLFQGVVPSPIIVILAFIIAFALLRLKQRKYLIQPILSLLAKIEQIFHSRKFEYADLIRHTALKIFVKLHPRLYA